MRPKPVNHESTAESKPLEKNNHNHQPEPNVPTQQQQPDAPSSGGVKQHSSSSCAASAATCTSKSYMAPPSVDGVKQDQLSPIAECRENGENCDRSGGKRSPSPSSPSSRQHIVKKEILTNDVISNANIVPPSNNTNNNAQQCGGKGGASGGHQSGGSPVHGATMKAGGGGGCIAGHAALTNSTLSSQRAGQPLPAVPRARNPGSPPSPDRHRPPAHAPGSHRHVLGGSRPHRPRSHGGHATESVRVDRAQGGALPQTTASPSRAQTQ